MVWLGVLIFFGILETVVLLSKIGGQAFETVRGDLFNIPPSLIAAWILYLVSKQHSDPMKKMWFWLALALLSLTLADCVWAYLELVLKIDPFPSVADIFLCTTISRYHYSVFICATKTQSHQTRRT